MGAIIKSDRKEVEMNYETKPKQKKSSAKELELDFARKIHNEVFGDQPNPLEVAKKNFQERLEMEKILADV